MSTSYWVQYVITLIHTHSYVRTPSMGKLLHFLTCKAVKNPLVGYTTFYLTTYWYLPVLTTGMKWYDIHQLTTQDKILRYMIHVLT